MPDPEPVRSVSQVTLKTVFTVCFGVLAVVALVYFVIRTQFSVTLVLGAVLIAVALNHVVEALERRGLRRKLAVLLVVFALLAIAAGLSVLIVPPPLNQAGGVIARRTEEGRGGEGSRWGGEGG